MNLVVINVALYFGGKAWG